MGSGDRTGASFFHFDLHAFQNLENSYEIEISRKNFMSHWVRVISPLRSYGNIPICHYDFDRRIQGSYVNGGNDCK